MDPSVSNTVSGDVSGHVLQTGVHIGDVHVRQGEQARSRYRELVRQIAPATLIGRAPELAELAEFCTASSTPSPYRWWRAPAWAGKSALMATFVLTPPQDVRIVSFFVTARLAGQSDRSAFLDSTLEQLATLLGRSVPAINREAHFHGMLGEAASLCAEQGRRLVLLVDGLDEDRGVTGADFHSIAALLPAEPPHGTRVIVSGRPHPPVPDDVPETHPLRDPAIVRVLEPSERARVVAMDMRRELDRLLSGSPVDRDLVGLLVASGGGLTGADLAELVADADWPRWRIEEHLRGVAGRSFVPLADPAGAYLLGHEELSVSAAARVGEERLSGYRDRLHAWADGYRERGWPAETPVYLLHAYHRVVDTTRLVDLVSDPARHGRMAVAFGGHHTAITEITTAQRVLLAGDPPDLPSMVMLNVHQHYLRNCDAAIPDALPQVWAVVGEVDRARSLARSITSPARRAVALAEIAAIVGLDHPQYVHLLDEAEEVAGTDDERSATPLVRVLTAHGVLDRAEALLRTLVTKRNVEYELEYLANAMLTAGEFERARSLIDLVGASGRPRSSEGFSLLAYQRTPQQVKAALLTRLVDGLARHGDLARARAVTAEIDDPFSRLLATAARIHAAPPAAVEELLSEAWDYRDALQDEDDLARAQAGAVACLAATGEHDAAFGVWLQLPALLQLEVRDDLVDRCPPEVAVRMALDTDEISRIEMLERIARNADHAQAVQVARTALDEVLRGLLGNSSHAHYSVQPLLRLFERAGLSAAAELESAVDVLPDGPARDVLLAELADAAIRSGDLSSARRLLQRGGESADHDHFLALRVSLLPPHGDFDEAEALVRALPRPVEDLAELALCVARAGQPDRARRLAGAAEDAARAVEAEPLRHWLTHLVEAVGERRRAWLIAEQAVATLRPDGDDEAPIYGLVFHLAHVAEVVGRPDLAARARGEPSGRLVAAAQRFRGRFRVRRRGAVGLPADEIAQRLLEEVWTEHISDIALLCPGLPERIHDTIVALTGLSPAR